MRTRQSRPARPSDDSKNEHHPCPATAKLQVRRLKAGRRRTRFHAEETLKGFCDGDAGVPLANVRCVTNLFPPSPTPSHSKPPTPYSVPTFTTSHQEPGQSAWCRSRNTSCPAFTHTRYGTLEYGQRNQPSCRCPFARSSDQVRVNYLPASDAGQKTLRGRC